MPSFYNNSHYDRKKKTYFLGSLKIDVSDLYNID